MKLLKLQAKTLTTLQLVVRAQSCPHLWVDKVLEYKSYYDFKHSCHFFKEHSPFSGSPVSLFLLPFSLLPIFFGRFSLLPKPFLSPRLDYFSLLRSYERGGKANAHLVWCGRKKGLGRDDLLVRFSIVRGIPCLVLVSSQSLLALSSRCLPSISRKKQTGSSLPLDINGIYC